jgi:hypothetical protein
MTTANSSNNATRPTGDRLSALTARPAKVTQTRVLVSEWIKLRSLRCTVWALIAIAAAAVGLAGLLPAFFVGRSVAAIEDLSIFLTTPGVAKAMVGLLPAWTGFAVYVGYAVLTLAAAAPELKRRDA